ncbi:MAG: hypothetical protein AAGK21_04305 [Bacteroidota bacterium]
MDDFSLYVEYNTDYTAEAARAVIDAIASTVEETYERVEPDPWTPDDLPPPIDRAAWYAAVEPDALRPPHEGSPRRRSEFLRLRLTPITGYISTVVFSRSPDQGWLRVIIFALGGAFYEKRGSRRHYELGERIRELDILMESEFEIEEAFEEAYGDEYWDLRDERCELESPEHDPTYDVVQQTVETLGLVGLALAEVHPVADFELFDPYSQDHGGRGREQLRMARETLERRVSQ